MTVDTRELNLQQCLGHLREHSVGRIAVVAHGCPIVVPVNYRLVEVSGTNWVAFRTRTGNILDDTPAHAALEIDGIDLAEQSGWSVLVRGTLHRVDPEAAGFRQRFDPQPWPGGEHDAWMAIVPFSITGRVLEQGDEWLFGVEPPA